MTDYARIYQTTVVDSERGHSVHFITAPQGSLASQIEKKGEAIATALGLSEITHIGQAEFTTGVFDAIREIAQASNPGREVSPDFSYRIVVEKNILIEGSDPELIELIKYGVSALQDGGECVKGLLDGIRLILICYRGAVFLGTTLSKARKALHLLLGRPVEDSTVEQTTERLERELRNVRDRVDLMWADRTARDESVHD